VGKTSAVKVSDSRSTTCSADIFLISDRGATFKCGFHNGFGLSLTLMTMRLHYCDGTYNVHLARHSIF
jgi:hypothetical protein